MAVRKEDPTSSNLYLLDLPPHQPQLTQAELAAIRRVIAEHDSALALFQQITTGCPVARMLTK